MKSILLSLGCLLWAPLHAAGTAAPNIVIIFIDDLGYGAIGPFGATKQKTPNLDHMAGEGMKLTSFYAAPVCSVSRAQLLTDQAQGRIVERYTNEAIGFIREAKDKPFLLYLPHTAVHTPIAPGEAFRGYNLEAVRQGPWKLAVAPQHETMGKGVLDDANIKTPRLYNLDAEIGEKTNLADQHPDIVSKLQALAGKMTEEIGGTSPKARRPDGQVANPTTLYPTGKAKPGAEKNAKAKAEG